MESVVLGLKSSVPWTRKEVVVQFRGHEVRVLPETQTVFPSIAVRLDGAETFEQGLIIGRQFLSALAWVDGSGIEEILLTGGPAAAGKPLITLGTVTTDFRPDYLPQPS